MDKIYAEVGARIRARRQRLELSLEDVSDLCGMHPAFIGQIERGVKKCSLHSIGVLAKALGVSASSFFAPKAAVDGATLGQLIDVATRNNNAREKRIILDVLRRLAISLKESR